MTDSASVDGKKSRWFNWFSMPSLVHVVTAFGVGLGVVLLIPEVTLALPSEIDRASVSEPSEIAEYFFRLVARVSTFIVGVCVGRAFAGSARFPFRGWLGYAIGILIGDALLSVAPEALPNRSVLLLLIGLLTLGELTGIGYYKVMSLQQAVAEHVPDRSYLRRLRR